MGPGPKRWRGTRALGPWAKVPGLGAHGPSRLFGPGPMGPYVFCMYVAHMLYIILNYVIFIFYLFHIDLYVLNVP